MSTGDPKILRGEAKSAPQGFQGGFLGHPEIEQGFSPWFWKSGKFGHFRRVAEFLGALKQAGGAIEGFQIDADRSVLAENNHREVLRVTEVKVQAVIWGSQVRLAAFIDLQGDIDRRNSKLFAQNPAKPGPPVDPR